MLKFQCKRNIEEEPYWTKNNFWPQFIRNEEFDHHYLIDTLKVICGEPENRRLIVENALRRFHCNTSYIFNDFDCDDADEIVFKKLSTKVNECKRTKKIGLLTYAYPAIIDCEDDEPNDDNLSHYTMLIVCPVDSSVYFIDSRGLYYAVNEHRRWKICYNKLQAVFKDYKWIDVIKSDIQGKTVGDSFCQTWSLLLTMEVLQCLGMINSKPTKRSFDQLNELSINITSNSLNNIEGSYNNCSLTPVIAFWKVILQFQVIKEAVFYEIYSHTHTMSGARKYDRYFSTLEEIVVSHSLTKNIVATRPIEVINLIEHVDSSSPSVTTDKESCSSSSGSGRNDCIDGSEVKYYKHGVSYLSLGYTFIEDFVNELDDALLQRILL